MPYPSPDDLRESRPNATTSISDERLSELVDEIADVIERYRGYAQVPRTVTETVTPTSTGALFLSWPLIRSIESVTVDNEPLSWGDVDQIAGIVFGVPGRSRVSVQVEYVHGLDDLEPIVPRLVAEYVASVLQSESSGTSRDVISQTFDGSMVRYSTPSWEDGRPTGFLEVDRLLNSLPDRRILPVA